MGDLGATLIKELNCETAFTIGGIGISESVVVTWIMMAVVLVVSLIVTHGLKVEHPGRGQLLLENAVRGCRALARESSERKEKAMRRI